MYLTDFRFLFKLSHFQCGSFFVFLFGGFSVYDFFTEELLKILLIDRTTGKNIMWATDDYAEFEYDATNEIKPAQINLIKPRYEKTRELKKLRTRHKGEIFTTSNICQQQNKLIDAKRTDWQAYVKYTVLEITCGEAPYLVSRYDNVTGEEIKLENRVGMLDKKLHIVNESCNDKDSWECWAKTAVQSVYGYELQGDNLFLARKNILLTYAEYCAEKFKITPAINMLKEIAEIISWNLWQMDGLTNALPYFGTDKQEGFFDPKVYCRIKDWKNNVELEFRNL